MSTQPFFTTELNYSEPECRVCLEIQTIGGQQLISPCKCSGSSRYVHESCLKEWIKQIYSDDVTLAQCEVCKQGYVQKMTFKRKLSCSYFVNNRSKCCIASLVLLYCMSLLVIITFSVVAVRLGVQVDTRDHHREMSLEIATVILGIAGILCILISLGVSFKYLVQRKLSEWQILNYNVHPKEKHPKVLKKFCEDHHIQLKQLDQNSQRNVQLELMMNNNENQNASSPHVSNYQIQNGLPSITYYQDNASNYNNNTNNIGHLYNLSPARTRSKNGNLQTISFFANIGVSEQVMHDFYANNDNEENSQIHNNTVRREQALQDIQNSKPNKITTEQEKDSQINHNINNGEVVKRFPTEIVRNHKISEFQQDEEQKGKTFSGDDKLYEIVIIKPQDQQQNFKDSETINNSNKILSYPKRLEFKKMIVSPNIQDNLAKNTESVPISQNIEGPTNRPLSPKLILIKQAK